MKMDSYQARRNHASSSSSSISILKMQTNISIDNVRTVLYNVLCGGALAFIAVRGQMPWKASINSDMAAGLFSRASRKKKVKLEGSGEAAIVARRLSSTTQSEKLQILIVELSRHAANAASAE